MTQSPDKLTQILELLNKLDSDTREHNQRLEAVNRRLESTNKRLENQSKANQRLEEQAQETRAQFKKWDDRYFQLVKEQGSTARTIIIAASSVVILAPVLAAVADVVRHFFGL